MSVTPELKRFFAEEIRAIGALQNESNTERVLDAFATVSRENHVGDGPWLLFSPLPGMESRRTPDSDPKHLYHNVLVALDEKRKINIGDPSLWARLLSQTPIAEGSSVLQVGAGSGYYTAILAELVGPNGNILATETDEKLASMATTALGETGTIEIRHANGAIDLNIDDGPFDLIIAFAGVTHPCLKWIERLKPEGHLLIPITGESWWGAMVLAQKDGSGFTARTLGKCGFFPCVGARDEEMSVRVENLWSEESRLSNSKLLIRCEGNSVEYEIDGIKF